MTLSKTPLTMWSALRAVVYREMLSSFRRRGDLLQPVLFFIIVVSLFPLSVTPDENLLLRTGAGIVWVAALLATLLALDTMFRPDFEDGSLEQLLLSPQPLSLLVGGKMLSHWILSGLPLVIISPFLALLMQLPASGTKYLALSLLLGTPALSLIGGVGVALTVSLKKSGVLLSLLILPLFVPVLIFGSGAVHASLAGLDASPHLLLLSAFSLFSMVICPLAASAALRISVN